MAMKHFVSWLRNTLFHGYETLCFMATKHFVSEPETLCFKLRNNRGSLLQQSGPFGHDDIVRLQAALHDVFLPVVDGED